MRREAVFHQEKKLGAPRQEVGVVPFIRTEQLLQTQRSVVPQLEAAPVDIGSVRTLYEDRRSSKERWATAYDNAAAVFETLTRVAAALGFALAFTTAYFANMGKAVAMTVAFGVAVPWWWPIAAVGLIAYTAAMLVRRFTKARLEKIKKAPQVGVRPQAI